MGIFKKVIFRIVLCALFLSANSYSYSESIKSGYMNYKWDFSFQNCDLDSALKMISDKTGVKFFTNGYAKNNILNKNYQDKRIEEILDDLLKETSYSVLWRYSDNSLVSAGIWIFGESSNSSAFRENNKFTANKIEDDVQSAKEVLWDKSNKKDGSDINRDFKATTDSERAYDKYVTKENNQNRLFKKNLLVTKRQSNRMNFLKRNIKLKPVVHISSAGKKNAYPEIPPIPGKFKNLEAPPMPPDFGL